MIILPLNLPHHQFPTSNYQKVFSSNVSFFFFFGAFYLQVRFASPYFLFSQFISTFILLFLYFLNHFKAFRSHHLPSSLGKSYCFSFSNPSPPLMFFRKSKEKTVQVLAQTLKYLLWSSLLICSSRGSAIPQVRTILTREKYLNRKVLLKISSKSFTFCSYKVSLLSL